MRPGDEEGVTAGGHRPHARDAIAPVAVERTRARYRVVRVVQDLAFVALAVAFSGPVGPLIELFTERLDAPLLERALNGSRSAAAEPDRRSHEAG